MFYYLCTFAIVKVIQLKNINKKRKALDIIHASGEPIILLTNDVIFLVLRGAKGLNNKSSCNLYNFLVVWFVRFVIIFTVHVPETDAKAHFRKEKQQTLLVFHGSQAEAVE